MSMQRTDQTKEGPSNLISSIGLDTILSGFSDYYQILKKVAAHPRTYGRQELIGGGKNQFYHALKIYLYGITVCSP
jgi:hypothetical protein